MERVLQVIRSMGYGGAETFIMNLYRNMDREKIQFDFLVNSDGKYDEEIRELTNFQEQYFESEIIRWIILKKKNHVDALL